MKPLSEPSWWNRKTRRAIGSPSLSACRSSALTTTELPEFVPAEVPTAARTSPSADCGLGQLIRFTIVSASRSVEASPAAMEHEARATAVRPPIHPAKIRTGVITLVVMLMSGSRSAVPLPWVRRWRGGAVGRALFEDGGAPVGATGCLGNGLWGAFVLLEQPAVLGVQDVALIAAPDLHTRPTNAVLDGTDQGHAGYPRGDLPQGLAQRRRSGALRLQASDEAEQFGVVVAAAVEAGCTEQHQGDVQGDGRSALPLVDSGVRRRLARARSDRRARGDSAGVRVV